MHSWTDATVYRASFTTLKTPVLLIVLKQEEEHDFVPLKNFYYVALLEQKIEQEKSTSLRVPPFDFII